MFGNSACRVDVAPALSHAFELTALAAVHSTNPVCSLENNTRPLVSVLLWLWLPVVLAALQLDGNQTDIFTLKGGLDKATT
jgi:hypothetical protein